MQSKKMIEIEEKTIDEAIDKACREFGVTRGKLNIEIISEGSSGFLGFMAKKAKIRASLLELDMDFALADEPQKIEQEESAVAPANRRETKAPARLAPRPVQAPKENRPARPAPAASNTPEPGRPEIKIKSSEAPPKPLYLDKGVAAASPAALQARQLLAGILERMTFSCDVTATETAEAIFLNISGDESGLLIGRRGQNLDALQYLLSKAVNRSDTDRKMIVVDSEDYRRRREASLLGMAERIREKVKKTQKPLSLAHMNAHDRRIIHLALQEDEELVTKSRGEGEYRKIIVLPARKAAGGSNGRAARSRP